LLLNDIGESMQKTIFSMLGVVALLALAQADSLACTCSLPFPKLSLRKQVMKARNESRVVFSGKVLEITENPQTYSVTVKLKVERVWKGSLPEEISIVTGRGGGDCGYRFELGESYLVYAYSSNESSLGTNICQRTSKLLGAANDLKILGKGKVVQRNKT
jgi:hypothetical protein